MELFPLLLSQTFFGNPKGPVELGNPNTCAVSKFYFIPSQEVVCYEPEVLYSWFKRKLGSVSLKTLFHRQTETTILNKNECITKFTTDENSIPRFVKLQSEINAIT